jgi:predicted RNase H-like nuclease
MAVIEVPRAGSRLRGMEVEAAVREALEVQVLEHEPGQAALTLRDAVARLGPEAVAGGLLDAAAVALRRLVAETEEAIDLDELLERMAVDGAVAPDSVDVLARMMTAAAATAGGIRPPADPVVADLGAERALFGAWLALLSIVRIVAISLERTEADVTEEIVSALNAP